MSVKLVLLLWVGIAVFLTSCSMSMTMEEMEISAISEKEMEKQLTQFPTNLKQIQAIIRNEDLSAKEKIQQLAQRCSIRDIYKIFLYLDRVDHPLPEEILTLHTAEEIFAAKASTSHSASFECMEASMLAAYLLREKKITPYILLLHGLNFQSGHAICIYRTSQGWGTIGINNHDYILPINDLAEFKKKLNLRFQEYIARTLNYRDAIWFTICTPEEIHEDLFRDKPILFCGGT